MLFLKYWRHSPECFPGNRLPNVRTRLQDLSLVAQRQSVRYFVCGLVPTLCFDPLENLVKSATRSVQICVASR